MGKQCSKKIDKTQFPVKPSEAPCQCSLVQTYLHGCLAISVLSTVSTTVKSGRSDNTPAVPSEGGLVAELVERRTSSEECPPGGAVDRFVVSVQSELVLVYLCDSLAVTPRLAHFLCLLQGVVVSDPVLIS